VGKLTFSNLLVDTLCEIRGSGPAQEAREERGRARLLEGVARFGSVTIEVFDF
jgi:hypothetical protein